MTPHVYKVLGLGPIGVGFPENRAWRPPSDFSQEVRVKPHCMIKMVKWMTRANNKGVIGVRLCCKKVLNT